MEDKRVLTEIITPDKMFFSGEVDMLIAETVLGQEGYLKDHSWCCKLLAENGFAKLKRDNETVTVKLNGGYIDVNDKFIIYTEDAQWEDSEQGRLFAGTDDDE